MAVGVVTISVLCSGAACGDGRPPFCDDLTRSASMSTLSKALSSRDLAKARAAAKDFRDLADSAPEGTRADLRDLATAVSDIVDLIAEERNTALGADPGGSRGRNDTAGADQARTELNQRLGELSTVSSRVERWAERNCGLRLS
ncbi:MAG: hypothetical protein JST64_13500 [Actinobacteria bacterium]|nr:hypothetical protein [Actinomycetota bacterium]